MEKQKANNKERKRKQATTEKYGKRRHQTVGATLQAQLLRLCNMRTFTRLHCCG